ncbi:MAG TPA: aldose 1-epimerase [Bryobacteraceae bacterium]|nr:aldose 1-epimerase [Bryobacteraceae bacterium]
MRARIYTAEQRNDSGIKTVHLADVLHGIEVGIAPAIGNRAYQILARGQNVLYFPFDNPAALQSDHHLCGIPFLAPWANRMPDGFYGNGKHYRFNPDSSSLRLDQNGIPIHGMLTSSPLWEVIDFGADSASAYVTSRLEFWRHPDLLANWPFAHEYEMTYRLAEGSLEISVAVTNLSSEPMPMAVGFHPYFQLHGVAIESAYAQIPVRSHVETDSRLAATGATTAVSFTNPVSLRDHRFDDGFTDLLRGDDGRAVFSVEGDGKKIEVAFGPRYSVAIVYAPPGQNYICFEPMSAITNGINLAHEGQYADLQIVAPRGCWRESFWIRPSGF